MDTGATNAWHDEYFLAYLFLKLMRHYILVLYTVALVKLGPGRRYDMGEQVWVQVCRDSDSTCKLS